MSDAAQETRSTSAASAPPEPGRGALKFRLLSAAALNVVDQAVKVISALLASPIIVHGIGMDGYGLWVLAVSLASYSDLLDFGFNRAAVRFYSRAMGADDEGLLDAFFRHLRRHYARLGWIITSIGLAFVAWGILPGAANARLCFLVGVLTFVSGITFFFRAHIAMLKARFAYGALVGVGTVRLTVFTGLLMAWGTGGLTMERLLVLQSLAVCGEHLALYWFARKLLPARSGSDLSPAMRSDLVSMATQYATASLAQALRQRFDSQLLGRYSTLANVTQNAVALRLPTLFFDLVNALFGGHLMAGLNQVAASGDTERLNAMLFKALRLCTAVAAFGCIGLCVFGPAFITRWLGNGFEPAIHAMQLLSIGMALVAAQYPVFAYLSAVDAYRPVVSLSLAAAFGNFLLSWFLVQRWGLMGVITGTVVEYCIEGLIFWPALTSAKARVPLAVYFRETLLKTALPLIAVVLPLALGLRAWIAPTSYLSLAGSGLALFACVAPLCWWFLLDASDRETLRAIFRRA